MKWVCLLVPNVTGQGDERTGWAQRFKLPAQVHTCIYVLWKGPLAPGATGQRLLKIKQSRILRLAELQVKLQPTTKVRAESGR